MRVTIEHLTEKGFFKKGYALLVQLEFSEVEKAVIKQAGLGGYLFMDAAQPSHSADGNHYTVGTIVENNGFKWFYNDLAAVKAKDGEVREKLKELKAAIEHNSGPAQQKDSFEL